MSILRIGLIGAGRWGRRYIATLAEMPGVCLARLASRNPGSLALVPSGCVVSNCWQEVAQDASLDGLVIATPPALHAEMAEMAMAAGIPVLIEKPMTISLAEARQLVLSSQQLKCLSVVGHTHLFSSAFRRLKEVGKTLGPLSGIRSFAGNKGPWRPDTPMLWDWAPHDLAMCLDLVGRTPESINVRRTQVAHFLDQRGESCDIRMDFSDRVVADVRVSNIDENKSRYFEARYRDGNLIYNDLAVDKLVFVPSGSGGEQPVSIDVAMPLNNLLLEFCAAIRADIKEHPSLRLGLEVVELLHYCDGILSVQSNPS